MKLFLSLFIGFIAAADSSALSQLTDQQLMDLRKQAMGRVDVVDRYEIANSGLPPEKNLYVLTAAYENFVDAAKKWNPKEQFDPDNTEACARYANNSDNLIVELARGYKKAQTHLTQKDALVLRTRLEVLSFLLLNQISLAADKAEGGQSLVTLAGTPCRMVDRDGWISNGAHVEASLKSLSQSVWGVRGISKPYAVSTPLLSIVNNEEQYKGTWSVATFAAESVVAVGLLSFGTKRLSAIFNLLGPTWSRFLKGTTLLALASYGGYKGYRFAEQRNKNLNGDMWTQIQASIEDMLDLDTTNTETYYQLSRETEKNLLQYNQALIAALEPDIKLAKEHFGSLDNARQLAESKLREINSEIERRRQQVGLVNKF